MFRSTPTAFDDCRKTAKVTLNILAIFPQPEKQQAKNQRGRFSPPIPGSLVFEALLSDPVRYAGLHQLM